MTKNTSIILSDHFEAFVDRQVDSGEFGSASEVIRAGLRLLEERQAKLAALRQALLEGEQSGPAAPFDMEEIISAAREEARAKPGRARDR
jgi:antitoxin ParD1/3/4